MEATDTPKKKGGGPSLETLQGVRHAMARVVRLMRDGKRDIELGRKLVAAMTDLAKVIAFEREQGLYAVTDSELEAEIDRRLAMRATRISEAAAFQ